MYNACCGGRRWSIRSTCPSQRSLRSVRMLSMVCCPVLPLISSFVSLNINVWTYIAPYGRNFRGAGGRSDQCSVKAWLKRKVLSLYFFNKIMTQWLGQRPPLSSPHYHYHCQPPSWTWKLSITTVFKSLHQEATSSHCALASCGSVYCNRSCLWVSVCLCVALLPDNSKLRASILTKLGL